MKEKLFSLSHEGKQYFCYIRKGKYCYNDSLALVLYDEEDDAPFHTITVCLEGTYMKDEYHAFVNVNNWDGIENFIVMNKLGVPTGRKLRSGYVIYPEYKFDKKIIDEIKFVE